MGKGAKGESEAGTLDNIVNRFTILFLNEAGPEGPASPSAIAAAHSLATGWLSVLYRRRGRSPESFSPPRRPLFRSRAGG
jgi:hypothetical protein